MSGLASQLGNLYNWSSVLVHSGASHSLTSFRFLVALIKYCESRSGNEVKSKAIVAYPVVTFDFFQSYQLNIFPV